MTDGNWIPNRCNEKAGFLFEHACDAGAVASCSRCSKPVCNAPCCDDEDGEPVCSTCAKQELQNSGRDQQVRGRGYGSHSRWRDDDPYFYGGYHYHGWGHYGHGYWGYQSYQHAMHANDADFTPSDSAALFDGDEADFESDMSES